MKNLYCLQVRAQCPVNPSDTDLYEFEIRSENMILVESIIEFFKANATKQNVYQEELTRQCAVTLGAKVTSTGWHSGIRVICESP
jgi:hypothetical protein